MIEQGCSARLNFNALKAELEPWRGLTNGRQGQRNSELIKKGIALPRKVLSRRYTDEEDLKIKELLSKGYTVKQIAVKLRRTSQAVRDRMSVLKLRVSDMRAQIEAQKTEPPVR